MILKSGIITYVKDSQFNRIKRKKEIARTIVEIFLFGMVYYALLRFTHFFIPCPIKLLTGYQCPGCGISHMFMDLFSGNLQGAFQDNPFVFVILLPGLLYASFKGKQYIEKGETTYSYLETGLLCMVLFGAIVFTVVRNNLV